MEAVGVLYFGGAPSVAHKQQMYWRLWECCNLGGPLQSHTNNICIRGYHVNMEAVGVLYSGEGDPLQSRSHTNIWMKFQVKFHVLNPLLFLVG